MQSRSSPHELARKIGAIEAPGTNITAFGHQVVRACRGFPQETFVILYNGSEAYERLHKGRGALLEAVVADPVWSKRLLACFTKLCVWQPRADFSYELRQGAVVVTDHDGSRSVTNDAEHVVVELEDAGIDLGVHHIVYRDTMGNWDGMLTREVRGNQSFVAFVPLRTNDPDLAITAMRRFMNPNAGKQQLETA